MRLATLHLESLSGLLATAIRLDAAAEFRMAVGALAAFASSLQAAIIAVWSSGDSAFQAFTNWSLLTIVFMLESV